nr:hypothetical protein L204_04202 [Cryptococcus depauperatus CBS 7855]
MTSSTVSVAELRGLENRGHIGTFLLRPVPISLFSRMPFVYRHCQFTILWSGYTTVRR